MSGFRRRMHRPPFLVSGLKRSLSSPRWSLASGAFLARSGNSVTVHIDPWRQYDPGGSRCLNYDGRERNGSHRGRRILVVPRPEAAARASSPRGR